ncbi:hemerythrin-like metal-binding protein [Delftia sp. Cs1-4]|uniref:hemerythrin domain-containing protein n=1 Tax=Delftia sp. (strain Cs1-4) TaxID=742013 RepID=UPI00020E7985|nr:hemerythrin domain-containing protein [Delftia sp. Cs1-4]AEF88685.1 hemerythrin-like metal-binding protein [Delftia sp. Cs1-4]
MSTNPTETRELNWHDGLVLGFAPMDAVHEEFVTLIGAVRHAPDAGVAAALDCLADHTRDHFKAEDDWMVESGFPGQACHSAEHAAVLQSIEGVRRRVAGGEFAAARRLADELCAWFPAHADYLDSALAHWMVKRRFGGKPIVLRRQLAPQASEMRA